MDTAIFSEVERLDKSLKEAKKNKNILEGQKNEIMRRLKEEFEVPTKEALSKKIKAGEEKVAEIETKLEKLYSDIKTKYSW